MASLSGVSSSNTLSSLMNSANMISGLASGLDTEGMIESLVKSYQTKINQLNQKVTKVEWKQDAYRSIISKMVGFSSKYTSYTSSTNLMSASFFSSAVKVAALGKYADAVSASGKTSSNISLNAVHQLATSAQYRTGSNLISGDGKSIEASEGFNLNGSTSLFSLNGNLTLTYGSQDVTVSFDQVADVKAIKEIRAKLGEDASNADVLAELINQKLSGQTISLTGGKTADAADRIQVTVKDGAISFSDKSSAGNSVFISDANGNVGTVLGIKDALENAEEDKDKPTGFDFGDNKLIQFVDNAEYLSGKTMNMSLDGVTKSITLPTIVNSGNATYILDTDGTTLLNYNAKNYAKVLNDAVQTAFKGKVDVSNVGEDGKLQLRFDVQEGSNLVINTSVGETLGIGRVATSYLNTSKTLGELLGTEKLDALTPAKDKDGNELLDKDGNKMYDFVINGVKVGSYSKNNTLAELMSDINSSGAGVRVSYSQTTKNFLFESKDTGLDSGLKLGGGLAKAMFGGDYGSTKITDILGENDTISKKFSFEIDGETFSGQIESNSETMQDLLDKLNSIFKDKGYEGYEASYSKERGLVVEEVMEDGERNIKELTYIDDEDGGNILRDIVNTAEPKDHGSDKLVDLLGTSTQDKWISFSINGNEYERRFTGNGGTVDSLVTVLRGMLKDDGYTVDYTKESGLVIRDANGDPVDVEYGDDEEGKVNLFRDIVDAVSVQDYSKDSLVDVLDVDSITNGDGFTFTVDGKEFTGRIDASSDTMDDLLASINYEMKESGYIASYSELTGELIVTDPQGREKAVEYDKDSTLGKILDAYSNKFKETNGNTYTKGQDAVFNVTINGETMQMTRSSNSVNIDGLTINMNDTFNTKVDDDGNPVDDNGAPVGDGGKYVVANTKESVTFKTSTDSDKIVDAIKAMVEDYNVMMAEIKSAYITMPYQKSGAFANYEPLTEDEMEGMSESAIARYEEKAKQGILFGDRTLSTLYTKMNQAFSFNNKADVDTLKDMGITVSYNLNDGAQAVTIDESKLRAMLDSDPDRVADLFTKNDGVMNRMKTQLDNYSKTTGEPKGILIQQAGSPLSSLSLLNNTWQSQIDNYTTQIEKWQNKLEAQIERYTSQFTRLETLINQMNSQSSALAGLMGGS